MADVLGERVRIYPDPLLRGQIKQRFPDSLEWPPIGLPEDYFPLLAPGRSAFVREAERLVGHGGASLEELVVPLVQIVSREEMIGRQSQIGFSQRIRLEWFEQTVHLILAGNNKTKINNSLQDLLRDKVSVGGASARGNREKVITILLKTWLTVPREREKLRDEGLEIFQRLPRKDRIAVHWGMVLAAYPFWGSVAAHTGRLLRLQGTAAAALVQRRVREQYGERETASRAARRVLRSFIDWAVLNETQDKGVYEHGQQYPIEEPGLIAWIVEASLRARSKRICRHQRSAGQSEHLSIPFGPCISRASGIPRASPGDPAAWSGR